MNFRQTQPFQRSTINAGNRVHIDPWGILGWSNDGTKFIKPCAEELADRMRNVVGTDLVRIYGQPTEEVTVELNRELIAELGLTATQIADKISQADSKVAAGTVRATSSDLTMEVQGAFEDVQRIATIPIVHGPDGDVVQLPIWPT